MNKAINEEIDKVRTSSENQTTFQKDPKIDKNKIIDDVEKVKNSNQSLNNKTEEDLVFKIQKKMILLIKLSSMTKSQLICQEVNLVIIFLKIVRSV